MEMVTLGVDVACRAAHQASLADDRGELIWTGRRFHTVPDELEALWAQLPVGVEVTVVMEPTRNAWVPLAAWFRGRGAKVVMVPPEQSADLRDYYSKHTKTDRLDSRILARLPLLHPDGLREFDDLGPAVALKRAVRRRANLVKRRTASYQQLTSLLELLGPAWIETLRPNEWTKTALAVLERYADPHRLLRLGSKRLTDFLIRHSAGKWRDGKADQLRDAARQSLALWEAGGLDFDELAADIAGEIATLRTIEQEIAALDARIAALYEQTDPDGILISVPGIATTLAAAILGRLGDPDRFANLAAVRSFTGLVPKISQSGEAEHHGRLTKAGDPGLREALWLAADLARKFDPTLAAVYYRLVVEHDKHHVSAVCHIATRLVTRIAACWRNRQHYIIRDTDGRIIDATEGRRIVEERFAIPDEIRRRKRRRRRAQRLKQRTGRREKESTITAAPASDPSTPNRIEEVIDVA